MTAIRIQADKCHDSNKVIYLSFSRLALSELAITVYTTKEDVLIGISMAAITGDNVPCTANHNPSAL
jgi:hypothetical protein